MGENRRDRRHRRRKGRGPEHTWRSMPKNLPVIRAEFRESGTVTDWALRRDYVQAAPGVVVLKPGDYDASAFGGFGLEIVTRVWANHLIWPDAVIGGWGAIGATRATEGLGGLRSRVTAQWSDEHRKTHVEACSRDSTPSGHPSSSSGPGDLHPVPGVPGDEGGRSVRGPGAVPVDRLDRPAFLVGPRRSGTDLGGRHGSAAH